jgi:hypothetical protein
MMVAPVIFLSLFELIGLIFLFNSVIAGLIFMLIFAMIFLPGIISIKNTEFAITTKRVIMKKGFAGVKLEETMLNKIESVDLKLYGGEFSGDVSFKGSGGTKIVFRAIKNPSQFKNELQNQINK